MNITLSADEEVVRRAREVARTHGKSLNQMVREYIQTLAANADLEKAADELFALMDEGGGSLQGQRFERGDAYEWKGRESVSIVSISG
jgi:hypothetical protein